MRKPREVLLYFWPKVMNVYEYLQPAVNKTEDTDFLHYWWPYHIVRFGGESPYLLLSIVGGWEMDSQNLQIWLVGARLIPYRYWTASLEVLRTPCLSRSVPKVHMPSQKWRYLWHKIDAVIKTIATFYLWMYKQLCGERCTNVWWPIWGPNPRVLYEFIQSEHFFLNPKVNIYNIKNNQTTGLNLNLNYSYHAVYLTLTENLIDWFRTPFSAKLRHFVNTNMAVSITSQDIYSV